MSYVESNLIAGEKIVYRTRLHWIVMFWHVFAGILLLGVPGAVLIYSGMTRTDMEQGTLRAMEYGGAFLVVIAIVVVAAGVVQRSATEMAVTNRRVVIKTGLTHRKTIEMMLGKVESIEVSESLTGRALGYGTIVVIGTGGTLEPFQKMAHPLRFRSEVQQQIESIKP